MPISSKSPNHQRCLSMNPAPIPANLLPRCSMQRIILHWTCGRRTANNTIVLTTGQSIRIISDGATWISY